MISCTYGQSRNTSENRQQAQMAPQSWKGQCQLLIRQFQDSFWTFSICLMDLSHRKARKQHLDLLLKDSNDKKCCFPSLHRKLKSKFWMVIWGAKVAAQCSCSFKSVLDSCFFFQMCCPSHPNLKIQAAAEVYKNMRLPQLGHLLEVRQLLRFYSFYAEHFMVDG